MAHLLEAAKGLVSPGAAIDSSSSDEYVEQLNGHKKDPDQWKLFRNRDRNYAVYRADFRFPGAPEPDRIVKVTELWLTKAQRVGSALLVPGVSVDYFDVSGASGYSGFKTWLINGTPQNSLEDIFWLPGAQLTGNGVPVVNDSGEQVTMPDLGAVCTSQMLALGDRLAEVNADNRVELPATVAH